MESKPKDEFADFASAFSASSNPAQSPAETKNPFNFMEDITSPTNPFAAIESTMVNTSQMNPSTNPLSTAMSSFSSIGSSPLQSMGPPPVSPTFQPMQPLLPTTNTTQQISKPSNLPLDSCNNVPSTKNNSESLSQNTWSGIGTNVNISVDNLFVSKYEKQNAPSMNQLAANMNTLSLNLQNPASINSLSPMTSPIRSMAANTPFNTPFNTPSNSEFPSPFNPMSSPNLAQLNSGLFSNYVNIAH